jgi:ParB-like chromosome segregation protein Spo0J
MAIALLEIASAYETSALSAEDDNSYDPMGTADQLPVTEIAMSSLSSGFFLRGTGTDSAHVRMLAEVDSFGKLPPILVQKNGLRIIDGTHRFEAAKQRGEITIRARIINCTNNDAFILAVKANTLHGLPLSRADRVLGAKRILDWHPDWSDRAIGIATGLSAKTIASIRRESADDRQQFSKRLGRDGKRRPVTAIEGRKRAAEFITAWPDASLREIARETDVSLGTVQDVRARMRSGLDPLTAGRVRPPLEAAESQATEPVRLRPSPLPSRLAPRGARRNAQQPAWPDISNKMMCDPSLKYTEGGRAFMRWMFMHVSNTSQWKEFVDSIPSHWLSEISVVAEQASEDWRDFAEHLKSRQDRAV